MVGELKDGQVSEYLLEPSRFGLPVHDAGSIRVGTVEESRAMLMGALENKLGAPRDIVALNAGAAIYVAGRAGTLEAGVEQAFAAIESGKALAKLEEFIKATQAFR